MGGLVACPDKNENHGQQPIVNTNCVPGQPGCNYPPNCVPGQPNCNPQPGNCLPGRPCQPSGYISYSGYLTNINQNRAENIGDPWGSFCWGSGGYCPNYDYGTIAIEGNPMYGNQYLQVYMNLGGYYGGNPGTTLRGTGVAYNINANRGTQIQVYFGNLYFNIVSQNVRIDGSSLHVPGVKILYNPDRHFADTTLRRNY